MCAPWVIFHCSPRDPVRGGIRAHVHDPQVVALRITAAREDAMEAEFGKYSEECFPSVDRRAASSALVRIM